MNSFRGRSLNINSGDYRFFPGEQVKSFGRRYCLRRVVERFSCPALPLLERVYKPGFVYHKAGVFLTDIVPASEKQQSFMERVDDEKQARVIEAVDRINRKHGRNTIRPLSMGFGHKWAMKQGQVSPSYTTRLDEVLRVRA